MKSFTEDIKRLMYHGITWYKGQPILNLGNGKYKALYKEWDTEDEAKKAINRAIAVLNKLTIIK